MRVIDEQYLETPTYGSRSMAGQFRRQGRKVNRKRIQRQMRLMGIEAVYLQPHTSRAASRAPRFPVPAAGSERRATQSRVGGRHHRRSHLPRLHVPRSINGLAQPQDSILAGLHPNTLDSDFCIEALREALER